MATMGQNRHGLAIPASMLVAPRQEVAKHMPDFLLTQPKPATREDTSKVNVSALIGSPKSTVKVTLRMWVGDGSAVEITGEGQGRLISATYRSEVVLPLPAGSSTPPSEMEAVRLPVLISDILKVNVPTVLLAGNGSDTVPPDADTSEAVNVVRFTCSPKSTMKVMLWALVGDGSVVEIVGLGAAMSRC